MIVHIGINMAEKSGDLLLLFNAIWLLFHLKSKLNSAKVNENLQSGHEILRNLWYLKNKIHTSSHITGTSRRM